MSSKLLNIGLSLVAVAMLSACGSSNDSGDTPDNTGGTDTENTGGATDNTHTIANNIDPIATLECEKSRSFGNITMTMDAGADGSFSINCTADAGEIQLSNNITVTQVATVESTISSSVQGDFTEIETMNYPAGTIRHQHTGLGGDIDCTETYDLSSLDNHREINHASDLDRFTDFDGNAYPMTNTTCPSEWYDEDDTDYDDEDYDDYDDSMVGGSGSASHVTNTTVTQESGTVSHISEVVNTTMH